VNTRIAELEDKPRREAVLVLQEAMVDDMLRKAAFMGEQLAAIDSEDGARAAKLAQLQALLQELKAPAAPEGAPLSDATAPAAPLPEAQAAPEAAAPPPDAVAPAPIPAPEAAPSPEAEAPQAAPSQEEAPAAPQPRVPVDGQDQQPVLQ
jgi:chemotaxis protein histidine kinase CheA